MIFAARGPTSRDVTLGLCVVIGFLACRSQGAGSSDGPAAPSPGPVVPKTSVTVQQNVLVENAISPCVSVLPKTVVEVENLVLVNLAIRENSNVGACGCKSKVLSYASVERITRAEGPIESDRTYGQFVVPPSGEGNLLAVVRADRAIQPSGRPFIRIGCAQPD